MVILAALFIVACGAIFSDFILRIFSKTQLESLLDEKDAGFLTRFFCRPFVDDEDSASVSSSMLSAFMVGIYFCYGNLKLADSFSPMTASAVLLIPIVTAVAFMNILSRLHTESLLISLCRPVWFLSLPFRPFGKLLILIEKKIASVFGDSEEDAEEDREEIIAAVADGEHDGVVEGTEREMIQNIFDLKNFDISDIMTPRTDICAIKISESFNDAIVLASQKGYSRIPVYDENRDDIKGIFYVKDALEYWDIEDKNNPQLKDLIRTPFFVPETKSVGELMQEFLQQKNHLAIVLDEYGGTAGLVTIEDVVEEIVGEIQDEYDSEQNELLETVSENVFIVDARLHVHDMNETLNDKVLPEADDYETVGGFVLDQLGHVPVVDEEFVHEEIKFTVMSADDRKIEKIRVEKIIQEDLDHEDAGNG
ncbi:MAG: hemolysin family protein [Planctomycetota bacterium]